MPELNDQINSSYDDAYQCEGDGVVDCTSTLMWISDTLEPYDRYWVGLRFHTGPFPPKGSTITAATLQIYAHTAVYDDLSCYIYGHDIANTPEFTTDGWNISQRTWTSASAEWIGASLGTGWKTSPSIVSIIQELVTDYDLTAIGFTLDPLHYGLEYMLKLRSYDYAGNTYGAKLHIEWTATAALTGTCVPTITQADVVAGGKTIVITLGGETWVATVGEDNAITTALIAGIDSAQSEAAGWDATAKTAITHDNVVRTSNTVVTITLPAVAAYYMTATETITVTIPASALTSAAELVATPTFTVTPMSCDDQIDASSDDAYEDESTGTIYLVADVVGVQSSANPASRVWGGLRWNNGPFPTQGSTILAAYFTVYAYENMADDANFNIYAEKAASPATFTTDDDNITDREPDFTDASVAWVANGLAPSPAWVQSPSIVDVIQELVDAVTPTTITLILKPNTDVTKGLYFRSWDYSVHVLGAKLHLEWTVPPAATALEQAQAYVIG